MIFHSYVTVYQRVCCGIVRSTKASTLCEGAIRGFWSCQVLGPLEITVQL